MTVRTAVLAHARVNTTAATQILVVPAGETWIIKSVQAYNAAASASSVSIAHVSADLFLNFYMFFQTFAAGETVYWDRWYVLKPGDAIWVQPAVADLRVHISGTRLLGVL